MFNLLVPVCTKEKLFLDPALDFKGTCFSVSSTDVQSPPTVLCDFCGQLFDTRKALSCHARAHLRHLGLSWSIKTSPIDLLKEVMLHGTKGRRESAPSGTSSKPLWSSQSSRRSLDSLQSGEPDTKPCTSPLDFSIKDKSPSGKSGASHPGKTLTAL